MWLFHFEIYINLTHVNMTYDIDEGVLITQDFQLGIKKVLIHLSIDF